MGQRLVWNFEFISSEKPFLNHLVSNDQDPLKWETRYFWSDKQIICLNKINNSLLDLANYQQKYKKDFYYLLPDCNYNIKRRHEELFYKPLIKKSNQAYGFGTKINLAQAQKNSTENKTLFNELEKILQQIQGEEEVSIVFVKKEAFIYKFPTTPTIKLELARLEIHDSIYFSMCIEGKSLHLVKAISDYLLDNHYSCDYVTFLKKIIKS